MVPGMGSYVSRTLLAQTLALLYPVNLVLLIYAARGNPMDMSDQFLGSYLEMLELRDITKMITLPLSLRLKSIIIGVQCVYQDPTRLFNLGQ